MKVKFSELKLFDVFEIPIEKRNVLNRYGAFGLDKLKYGVITSIAPGVYGNKRFSIIANLGESYIVTTAAWPIADKTEVEHLEDAFCENVLLTQMRHVTNKTGNDPEIFATDEKGNLIPAFIFLPDKKTGAGVYWDGYQAEFTTQPDNCHGFQIDSVREGLLEVHKRLTQKIPNGRLTIQNVFEISDEDRENAQDKHVELGCAPSKNAYGEDQVRVDNARALPYRFAGGHIHLGIYTEEKMARNNVAMAVKAMDAIAGVASVGMAASFDIPVRREYYGRAGEYRTPAHGVEWRTLSNFWLSHPAIAHLTLDLARKAANFGFTGVHNRLFKYDEQEVRNIINFCDVKAARKYVKANERAYEALIGTIYLDAAARKRAKSVILNGIESLIKDPNDIVNNWRLDTNWEKHTHQDKLTFTRFANANPNME